jgi:uncharacterized membrane protein YqjE
VANPVHTLLGAASGLAHSRLALLGTEVREELGGFACLLLAGCAAVLLGALGLAAIAAAVVLAVPEPQRVLAASAFALLFVAMTAYAVMELRRLLQSRTAAFAASLAELERDREALIGESRASRSDLAQSGGELLRLVSIGLAAYSVGKRLRRAA